MLPGPYILEGMVYILVTRASRGFINITLRDAAEMPETIVRDKFESDAIAKKRLQHFLEYFVETKIQACFQSCLCQEN